MSAFRFRFLLPALLLLFLGQMAGQAQEGRKADPHAAFAKADAALNVVWAKAKAALSDFEFNKLKEEQRAWIDYRDSMARDPRLSGVESREDLPPTAKEYLEIAAHLTEQRTQWIEGRISPKGGDGITGIWIDSYGGHIEIVEEGETLAFIISCARGPTSHAGELRGLADWGSRLGWFKEKPSKENPDMLARLAFIYRDGHQLEVVGASTSWHHGANAYFDGIYTKVDTLSPQKQKEVLRKAKNPVDE
ncbi:MAG TPA: lysozyme inhibitor LprI family protein [Prosthecobacter sp.]